MPNQVVINDVTPREQFTSSAGQQIFNVLYTADATTDIDVYARASIAVDPNDILQIVNPVDYTVTFVGVDQTVRVTFGVGRSAGEIITIARNTPPTRTNLYINTNFTPSMLNEDFGVLTLIDQQAQMYDEVIAPHYNVSAVVTPADINTGEGRDIILPILDANQGWVKNPTDTEIIAYTFPSSGTVAPGDATYIVQTPDADLPNAQALNALTPGILVATAPNGVLISRQIDATSTQTTVLNGDGVAANPTIGLASNAIVPGIEGLGLPVGTTAQRPGAPPSTSLRKNTDTGFLEFWNGAAWVVINSAATAPGAIGTEFQVLANGTFGTLETGTVTFTTPQDIAPTSDVTFNSVTTGLIYDPTSGELSAALSAAALSVEYPSIFGNLLGDGPGMIAQGPAADTNLQLSAKGDASVIIGAEAVVNPMVILRGGTAQQHQTLLISADTAAIRSATFQDSDGTFAWLTDIIPGGNDTEIQYNNAGAFAGDTGFTTNGAGSLDIIGDLSIDNININGNAITSTAGVVNITPLAGENLTIDVSGDGEVILTGSMDIIHTCIGPDEYALEIDTDAAGFGDCKAIDIVYTTGALAANSEEGVIAINIDDSASLGGEVYGLEVITTPGTANVFAVRAGALVSPVEQLSGTFGNADLILNIAVDVTAALASGGAGAITAFNADNDTFTVGDAATFEEISFELTTIASQNIQPTFRFSTGVGTWTSFTPTDGTNGMRNTGVIVWDLADVPTWAVGAGGLYLIEITRTRNTVVTDPVLAEVQISAVVEYLWHKTGTLAVKSVTVDADPTTNLMLATKQYVDTRTPTLTDGQVWIGDTGTNAVAATLTPGTGIVIGGGAGTITISTTGGGFDIATIAGTSQSAAINTMYIALNAAQTTVTLPGTCAVGDTVILVGATANVGGWILDAPAGDTITYNGSTTSSGGTITSSALAGQTIEVVCDVANTSWIVVDTVNTILTTA